MLTKEASAHKVRKFLVLPNEIIKHSNEYILYCYMVIPSSTSRRSIGNIGENIACRHLEWKWYTIRERNYQIKWGEIDIIAQEGEWTIFVEVRYRKDEAHGHPLDTFGFRKRKTLERTVYSYIHKYRMNPEKIRIDFIGIIPKKDGTAGYRLWHVKGI